MQWNKIKNETRRLQSFNVHLFINFSCHYLMPSATIELYKATASLSLKWVQTVEILKLNIKFLPFRNIVENMIFKKYYKEASDVLIFDLFALYHFVVHSFIVCDQTFELIDDYLDGVL